MPRLTVTPTEIQKHLALLEETPRRIARATAGLDEGRLRQSPGERQWSAVEILAHLRACEEIWSFSIYAMLCEDNPALPLLDERRWAKAAHYASLDFHKSLQAFALNREELLRVLRNLPQDAWSGRAMIEGRPHIVFSQARRMALHEQEHCAQIETLLSSQSR